MARIVALFVYTPIFFYLAKSHRLSLRTSDYILTVFTFLLLWILLTATGRHPRHSVPVHASRESARFSYTLYAVHTPVIIFVASLLVHDSRWQPTPIHLLIAGGILLATVAYSFAIASLTEFRTDAFRIRVEHLLGMRPTSSVLPSNPAAEAP
jgi:peptidoglycan/LPS O-acetylase OafA/YrhL